MCAGGVKGNRKKRGRWLVMRRIEGGGQESRCAKILLKREGGETEKLK